MILVALDVDGTLDCTGRLFDATGHLEPDRVPARPGPFPWRIVEALHFFTPPGLVRFVVVSGSPDWPGSDRTGIPVMADGPDRADDLRAAAAAHPWCDRRIYIGDEELDRAAAEAAGFEFVPAADYFRLVAAINDATEAGRQPSSSAASETGGGEPPP